MTNPDSKDDFSFAFQKEQEHKRENFSTHQDFSKEGDNPFQRGDSSWVNIPKKKKLANFWYYYKIPVIIIAFLLIFAGTFIYNKIAHPEIPYALAVIAVNSEYKLQDNTPITDMMQTYADQRGIDTSAYLVNFRTDITLDLNYYDNYAIAIDSSLSYLGESDSMDILIGGNDIIDHYFPDGFYNSPLDTLLPEDLRERFAEEDRYYVYEDPESGGTVIAGIYIGDAPRFQEIGLYKEDSEPILSIVSSSSRIDNAVAFIRFLFEEP